MIYVHVVFLCMDWNAPSASAFMVVGPFSTTKPSGMLTKRYYRNEGDKNGSSKANPASSGKANGKGGGALQHQEILHNHMVASSSSSSWHRTDELWDQDWHDAFIRNGLVDFCPPMTDFLFCLKVGGGNPRVRATSSSPVQLPWKNDDNDKHSGVEEPPPMMGLLEEASHLEAAKNSHVAADATRDLLHEPYSKLFHHKDDDDDHEPAGTFRYDCIFDTNLMNDLLVPDAADDTTALTNNRHNTMDESNTHEATATSSLLPTPTTITPLSSYANVAKLLLEAHQTLQEHGIYVAVTEQPIAASPQMQDFLEQAGRRIGLQWHFDLQEISGGSVHVSVARKYFSGALPSFGKLATMTTTTTTAKTQESRQSSRKQGKLGNNDQDDNRTSRLAP